MSGPRRRAPQDGRDAGFTLVELIVAMGVFTVLMSLVLTAVVGLSRATVRVQNVGDASDRLRQSFLTMDRQVRYADAINLPGSSGGTWWVELHTSPVGAATPARCTQWRYTPGTQELEQRTWTEGTSPSGGWRTIATQILSDGAPFTLLPADSTYVHQELTVHLRSGSSDSAAGGRSGIDTRFVARNSTPSSPGNIDAGGDGVSDEPVCGPLATVRS